MGLVVVLVVIVLAAAAIAVLLKRGGTPEESASHAGEREPRADVAGRSVAGPADAGAESEHAVDGDAMPG